MKPTPPPHIAKLQAYKPGKPIADVMREHGLTDVTKLASNENPLGASPLALAEIEKSLDGLNFYPNGGKSLREAIANRYGLEIEEVIAGSGSEGVMNTLMRTFLMPGDEVVTSEGTFSGFYVLAHAMDLKLELVPLNGLAYDLDAIAERVTSKTKLVYLANPNNPTGSAFGRKAFDTFYKRIPKNVIVLHDEAYYDFAIDDFPDFYSTLTDIQPNVITLRTFSKSHGLAGVRIGFATGPKEMIEPMLKVKLPFEPSVPAQAAGIGALADDDFLKRTIETNRVGKQYLKKVFDKLGLEYGDTAANFFCVRIGSEQAASEFVESMERHGIIVRPLAGFGLSDCVRISIGTPEQNAKAAVAMEAVLADLEILSAKH